MALALAVSMRVQALPEEEDPDLAAALAFSMEAQALPQEEDPELAAALAASIAIAEQKSPAENALVMRLNQAQQAYEGGEYKNQADANLGFLARLDMKISDIANEDILRLRNMLEQIERKVQEALEQNNTDFVGALFERNERIQAYVNERQAIPAAPAAQQPAMLPAASAAGVGLNAAPNDENGELKIHIEADEQLFLTRLDLGIQTNIRRNTIPLLRKMLERIEPKLNEALQQNNNHFVQELFKRQEKINAHINGGIVISAPAQHPAMLPAARAAGIGLNVVPDSAVNRQQQR
jgi:hypothetical protein